MSRIVVSRGDRFDVSEWAPGAPTSSYGAPPGPPKSPPLLSADAFGVVAAVIIVAATGAYVLTRAPQTTSKPLPTTTADVAAVHAHVSVAGVDVRGAARAAPGDTIATDADGRGRLRLDDGTTFVLDRGTRLVITDKGVRLEAGRAFVASAAGAHTEIELGASTAILGGATAAIERSSAEAAKVYAANGDVTLRAGTTEQIAHTGETATIAGAATKIAPERGFDDWTSGMASPWSTSGPPRRAIGELWGHNDKVPGAIGAPLTIRASEVHATISREVAETEVTTTFFNAGSESVAGDFRMAIPRGAIVSRYAVQRGDAVSEGHVALASRGAERWMPSANVLEWAGEGWLRGAVFGIAPGQTVAIIVRYVEWLPVRAKGDGKNLVVEYRYPLVSDGTPPLIGEFSATVDAGPSGAFSVAAGQGARVNGSMVELRKPDFRPSADLVVDVEIDSFKAPARLYAAPATDPADASGTIVVRTEVPADARDEGVTLAVVLDTSASIEPALLDAERALVDAILGGLGAKDRVVVLAADQTAKAVGPSAMGPLDPARRKAITEALAKLSTGGASDLGRALEAAADALPSDATSGMVIYVGDGWPTLGDANVSEMLARLARRPGGVPRLGAVGVGPLVNRFGLAALVRGSGPIYEIADPTDAAKTAVSLIADALQPTVSGVEIVFGPEVDRVYPRGPRAEIAGGTITAVGRVRGATPTAVTLKWRDAKGAHEERRAVTVESAPSPADVTRRWAAARIEEIAIAGKGREAATDVALRAGLLTPWTGWVLDGAMEYQASTLSTRVLDVGAGFEDGFSASMRTVFAPGTLVAEDVDPLADDGSGDNDDAMKQAILAAAHRALAEAAPSIRACRDTRAALRPEIGGGLDASFSVDGEGHATKAKVRGESSFDDAALDRCVEIVIEALGLPASGLKIDVTIHDRIQLAFARATLKGHKCSPTSTLPMPLRRGVWRERLDRAGHDGRALAAAYLDAKQSCELPTWTDRRALLELVLDEPFRVRLDTARELEANGDDDAARLLRRETVRRARSPEELAQIRRVLLGDERYPKKVFVKQYRAASDDAGRLAVVRKFLALAPHDALLRGRLVALLEALGKKQELVAEIERFRHDPFSDAGLLADGASALRRIGEDAEARRAFGELAERAPRDPFARAFLGDRLQREGLFDDATLAYRVLAEQLPDDPRALLRLALANAGGGRLDVARRMLARVAETGGRRGESALGEIAGVLAQSLVAEARRRPGVPADELDRLTRAALELPMAREATLLLVRSPPSGRAVVATVERGPKEARDERGPDALAPGIGLSIFRLEGQDGAVKIKLHRPEELAPARPRRVRVDALVPDGDGKPPRLTSAELDLPPDGKEVTATFASGAFAGG